MGRGYGIAAAVAICGVMVVGTRRLARAIEQLSNKIPQAEVAYQLGRQRRRLDDDSRELRVVR